VMGGFHVEKLGRRKIWLFGATSLLLTWLGTGVTAQAGARTLVQSAAWREPLSRAEIALANGEMRQAEQAWEEARRAAIRSRMPHGLLEVGVAYLSIGEVTRDRRTALSRARQLFLESLFQARERRDVDGIAAAGQAFASLGDCEVAERAHAVVVSMSSKRSDPPSCARADSWRQPSASPRLEAPAPAPTGPQAR
jgi:hypothetical protein